MLEIKLINANQYEDQAISIEEKNDDFLVYKIKLTRKDNQEIKKAVINLDLPMLGILSQNSPTLLTERGVEQWFRVSKIHSSFYYGSPFLSIVDKGSLNYATLAVSDAINDLDISFKVIDFDQKETVRFTITLLSGFESKKEYSCYLRLDLKKQNISQTQRDLSKWFKSFYPNENVIPEEATYPLYSTWYNFHQHPNQKDLTKELQLMKETGFKSLILDDGWQFDGNGNGDYSLCGEYNVSKEKFPDLSKFVEDAHLLGIKVSVWFPIPFIGIKSPRFDEFKNYCLFIDENGSAAGILDPRYKKVRDFLINTFSSFVKTYNLDGLKLDFIDSFKLTNESKEPNSEMDITSLYEAVETLCRDIYKELTSINQNIMIEYRQRYVGPVITNYCNMLRVLDCAFDSVTNRIGVLDLRQLNYKVAIHSDMLYWSKDESLLNISKQLLNVVYSVPQISVNLTNSTDEQRNLIKSYISYWEENKQTLLFGNLEVKDCNATYSQVKAIGQTKDIITCYLNNQVSLSNKNVDVLNGSNEDLITLVNKNKQILSIQVFNRNSELVESIESDNSVLAINIEIGGRIEVRQ